MFGPSVGVGVGHVIGGGFDPSAQAFFTATGITGTTEQQAVNTLVTSLKSAGLWSKMKAVYPFVTDNRNLLSYTEDFGNAYWTKNNSTVTTNSTTAPNGTTTADLFTLNTANAEHNIYAPVSGLSVNANQNFTFSCYVKKGTGRYFAVASYFTGVGFGPYATYDLNTATLVSSGATYGTYISSNIQDVGNGWYRLSVTGYGNYTSVIIALDARSASSLIPGGIFTGTGETFYLWGAQLELGSTATTYQPIATTQQSFISNQFKYNLVNPVDSDAAFRGVFNGGWTFSNQGIQGNAINSYLNTNVNALNNLNQNNTHLSFYCNNSNSGNTADSGTTNYTVQYYGGSLYYRINNGTYVNYGVLSALGMTLGSRLTSTQQKLFKNGSVISTDTATSQTPDNFNIYLGAINTGSAGSPTSRRYAFSSIGDGLTDTEATALYNAVQTMNTTLSRNV